jgi:hypothetical protein
MLQPLGAQFAAPEKVEAPDFETEAKLENFSSSLFPLHAGHLTFSASDFFKTSVSNSLPQSRQMNS